MADFSPSDDWWQASDGKYYPPETHPQFRPDPSPASPSPRPSTPSPSDPRSVPRPGPPPRQQPSRVRHLRKSARKTKQHKGAGGWVLPIVILIGMVVARGVATSSSDSAELSPISIPTFETIEFPTPLALPPIAIPTLSLPQPAAEVRSFGDTVAVDDWNVTLVAAHDGSTGDWLTEIDPPAGADETTIVIEYKAENTSDRASAAPLRISGLGTTYIGWLSRCLLGEEALLARGLDGQFSEIEAGRTIRSATCFVVPTSEVTSMLWYVEGLDPLTDPHLYRIDALGETSE